VKTSSVSALLGALTPSPVGEGKVRRGRENNKSPVSVCDTATLFVKEGFFFTFLKNV
jgi:hypothetical protein